MAHRKSQNGDFESASSLRSECAGFGSTPLRGFGSSMLSFNLKFEYKVVFKKITKKNADTKLKGLEELRVLLIEEPEEGATKSAGQQSSPRVGAPSSEEDLLNVLTSWVNEFLTLAECPYPQVRVAAVELMGEVAKKYKKSIALQFKVFFPTWVFAAFDPNREVSAAAERSIRSVIPPSKYKNAVAFCQIEILSLVASHLEVAQTDAKDEEEAESAGRLVSASILLFSHLLSEVPSLEVARPFVEEHEMLKSLVSKCQWPFEKVRASVCVFFTTVARRRLYESMFPWSGFLIPMFSSIADKDMGVQLKAWEAVLTLVKNEPGVWTRREVLDLNGSKRLTSILKKALTANKSHLEMYRQFRALLCLIDKDPVPEQHQFFHEVLKCCWSQILDQRRLSTASSYLCVLLETFFTALKFAVDYATRQNLAQERGAILERFVFPSARMCFDSGWSKVLTSGCAVSELAAFLLDLSERERLQDVLKQVCERLAEQVSPLFGPESGAEEEEKRWLKDRCVEFLCSLKQGASGARPSTLPRCAAEGGRGREEEARRNTAVAHIRACLVPARLVDDFSNFVSEERKIQLAYVEEVLKAWPEQFDPVEKERIGEACQSALATRARLSPLLAWIAFRCLPGVEATSRERFWEPWSKLVERLVEADREDILVSILDEIDSSGRERWRSEVLDRYALQIAGFPIERLALHADCLGLLVTGRRLEPVEKSSSEVGRAERVVDGRSEGRGKSSGSSAAAARMTGFLSTELLDEIVDRFCASFRECDPSADVPAAGVLASMFAALLEIGDVSEPRQRALVKTLVYLCTNWRQSAWQLVLQTGLARIRDRDAAAFGELVAELTSLVEVERLNCRHPEGLAEVAIALVQLTDDDERRSDLLWKLTGTAEDGWSVFVWSMKYLDVEWLSWSPTRAINEDDWMFPDKLLERAAKLSHPGSRLLTTDSVTEAKGVGDSQRSDSSASFLAFFALSSLRNLFFYISSIAKAQFAYLTRPTASGAPSFYELLSLVFLIPQLTHLRVREVYLEDSRIASLWKPFDLSVYADCLNPLLSLFFASPSLLQGFLACLLSDLSWMAGHSSGLRAALRGLVVQFLFLQFWRCGFEHDSGLTFAQIWRDYFLKQPRHVSLLENHAHRVLIAEIPSDLVFQALECALDAIPASSADTTVVVDAMMGLTVLCDYVSTELDRPFPLDIVLQIISRYIFLKELYLTRSRSSERLADLEASNYCSAFLRFVAFGLVPAVAGSDSSSEFSFDDWAFLLGVAANELERDGESRLPVSARSYNALLMLSAVQEQLLRKECAEAAQEQASDKGPDPQWYLSMIDTFTRLAKRGDSRSPFVDALAKAVAHVPDCVISAISADVLKDLFRTLRTPNQLLQVQASCYILIRRLIQGDGGRPRRELVSDELKAVLARQAAEWKQLDVAHIVSWLETEGDRSRDQLAQGLMKQYENEQHWHQSKTTDTKKKKTKKKADATVLDERYNQVFQGIVYSDCYTPFFASLAPISHSFYIPEPTLAVLSPYTSMMFVWYLVIQLFKCTTDSSSKDELVSLVRSTKLPSYSLSPIFYMSMQDKKQKAFLASKLSFYSPFHTYLLRGLLHPTARPYQCLSRFFHLQFDVYYSSALLFKFLSYFPALGRSWYNDLANRSEKAKFESFVQQRYSPALIAKELACVSKFKDQSSPAGSFRVKCSAVSKEIVALYRKDDTDLTVVLKISDAYPFKPISVAMDQKLASEALWRKWMFTMLSVLNTRDRSISDALTLWKSLLEHYFEGIDFCPICYSVFYSSNLKVPSLACKTCKNKFHSACLYKWFNTSHHSECPICRTSFT